MFSWLTRWFRPNPLAAAAQAHMTFGQKSVGRSISRAGVFLKKQLWIWPIIAVVLLSAIGWGVSSAIEQTMQENLRSELKTLVGVERAMLETWLNTQKSNAESLANDQQIRVAATEILVASQPPLTDEMPPPTAPAVPAGNAARQARLAQELGPGMTSHQFANYFVADKQRRIIAADNPILLGQTVPSYESFLNRSLDGVTTVCAPFPSVVQMTDEHGRMKTDVPTMFVSAPIRDANFQVIAVLALRIRPEREFTRILQLGRLGQSGETYAFDKSGLMVSNSRFDNELIMLGLLPDTEHAHSLLTVSIRDPGGNMKEGYRPQVRRAELPLTAIAAAAVSGKSGIMMDAYNDYRGIPSVGAYEWLPEYEMGLLTEIDYAEAFHPLTILKRAFYSLYALLALSSAAIFVFTIIVARMQREAQKAAIEAKQLGQYRLEAKLGAGAMGVVYKGHHAMLRRPTAIKMLNVDRVNETSIQRFEREVQITCKLNSPNTVAIYDYGRTPEGVFYYAMEYLDGIDLQQLVEKYGPQSEGRVIEILQQICASLHEAHSLGLVHRDIKPANIMLNRRGGQADVIKVLDFGLVKAIHDEQQTRQSGGLAGTPLYMSPEAIRTPELVDSRSDLYAVGAVGYFLLTGKPVFNATSLVDLCQQQLAAVPDSPSQRLGQPVTPELESALLACLEKSCAKRPQTARDLSLLLERAHTAQRWTSEDAEDWWGRHERGQVVLAAVATSSSTNLNGTTDSRSSKGDESSTFSLSPGTPTKTVGPALDRTIDH
jgi:serine/threonine protein kinase